MFVEFIVFNSHIHYNLVGYTITGSHYTWLIFLLVFGLNLFLGYFSYFFDDFLGHFKFIFGAILLLGICHAAEIYSVTLSIKLFPIMVESPVEPNTRSICFVIIVCNFGQTMGSS